ncbi:diphosphomevalonate decarboxylase [Nocardia gamkensis]|nr:diphosphomevalonate decarboxylase [Nocardia gamkensis]NQE66759.1 Diphosphomevalonate decarboxylase [Nocardia gamkensis]
MSTSATAIAHPNIALIKYWGKRDAELILPNNDSLSMTLDIHPTTTTVTLDADAKSDELVLNGIRATDEALIRARRFLDEVRARSGVCEYARIDSHNEGPTAAGLASSAAGFAALAVAASAVYGLDYSPAQLSRLARRGSGSAARSVFGGFAQWHAGHGSGPTADETSFAEPVEVTRMDIALVVAVVDAGRKALSSRDAMRHTVATSPLYWAWVDSVGDDITEMRAALCHGDLHTVGAVAERNALGMHATMLAARPAVRFLSAASLRVFDEVARLRSTGLPAYVTVDAGPNVKVLCSTGASETVAAAVRAVEGVRWATVAQPGPAARLRADVRS